MTPTEQELRDLDAWIVEHVMGLVLQKDHPFILKPNYFVLSIPNKIVRARIGNRETKNFEPTSDSADAMGVLKKCYEIPHLTIAINCGTTGWWIGNCDKKTMWVTEPTLELAISKFAKQLF